MVTHCPPQSMWARPPHSERRTETAFQTREKVPWSILCISTPDPCDHWESRWVEAWSSLAKGSLVLSRCYVSLNLKLNEVRMLL